MKKLICLLTLLAATAHADVTVGPIIASGMPGDPVDFIIAYDGPLDTNGVSFNILYPTDADFSPVFRANSLTAIQCLTAPDLADITTSAVLIPGKIAFTVLGLDLSTGPIPFGRTGVLGTCKFTIKSDAKAGLIPLTCDPDATTASDVNGNNLPATCLDGVLRVIIPPTFTAIPHTPMATATHTPTSTAVPSDTAVSSETPVATSTAVPATETPAPAATDTAVPLATDTPPPVSTATAVNTEPPVPTISVSTLQQLIALIEASGLPDGQANNFTSTLYAAIDQVTKGHLTPACNQIGAFLNKVEADRDGSKMPADQALAFIDGARSIRSQLGCERPR